MRIFDDFQHSSRIFKIFQVFPTSYYDFQPGLTIVDIFQNAIANLTYLQLYLRFNFYAQRDGGVTRRVRRATFSLRNVNCRATYSSCDVLVDSRATFASCNVGVVRRTFTLTHRSDNKTQTIAQIDYFLRK